MKKISLKNLEGLIYSEEGLSSNDVLQRREIFGLNEIVEVSKNKWLEIAKESLSDPMIWLLFLLSIVFFIVHQVNDGITLMIAIFPILGMDFFLHWRTIASTQKLKSNLQGKITVMRDSIICEVDSLELLPGDLAYLKTGQSIPADGIFHSVDSLQVDEANITGESIPVRKSSVNLSLLKISAAGESFIQEEQFAYAGTRVLTGEGQLRVLTTGEKTTYGNIIKSLSLIAHEPTLLQKSIAALIKKLIIIAFAFCLLLASVRLYQGHGWLDALLSSAVFALAAFPEEFSVVFVIFLGLGVYRLASKGALVRRAVSVENIGRVTQLCTDKTGTITKGELNLTHLVAKEGLKEEQLLFWAAQASNDQGSDPIDEAILLKYSEVKGMNIHPTFISRFPFTEDRRRETVILSMDNSPIAVSKGAPETILAICSLNQLEKNSWETLITKYSNDGHKVLALAKVHSQGDAEPSSEMEFLGLLAFEDILRVGVDEAIQYCKQQDIHVLMITGDHPATALAIAKEAGMGGKEILLLNAEKEIDKFEDKFLKENPKFFNNFDVVARCNPLQKLKIVTTLKQTGEIVAVTGDGVNDVPALKAADIGIAMGKRGTKSAKEVASIIISDDNFKTIIGAINEGRILYVNLKMSFEYLLLIHIPFVLSAAIIPLLGYSLIYKPVHIVLCELMIHPTAILAFQSKQSIEKLNPKENFLSLQRLGKISFIGLLLTMGIILNFIYSESAQPSSQSDVSTTMAFMTLVFWNTAIVIFYTKFNNILSFMTSILILLSALCISSFSEIFYMLQLTTLSAVQYGRIAIIIVIVFIFLVLTFRNSSQNIKIKK